MNAPARDRLTASQQGEPMQHVRLGPTGLRVSRPCLGTMTLDLRRR